MTGRIVCLQGEMVFRIVVTMKKLSLCCLVLFAFVLVPASAAALEIDADKPGEGFDIEMSVHLDKSLQGWAVWKRYHMSKEWVMARRVDAAGNSVGEEVVEVTDGAGIFDGVSLAASDDGEHLWVFWSQYEEAKWSVKGRNWRREGGWDEVENISDGDGHALKPRAVVMADETTVVVWHELVEGGNSRAMFRILEPGGWANARELEKADTWCFRPVPVRFGGKVWAVWDGRGISTPAMPIWPDAKGVDLSRTLALGFVGLGDGRTPSRRRMHGEPVYSESEGLCIPNLTISDVIAGNESEIVSGGGKAKLDAATGGDGVVDMLHTANVALVNASGHIRYPESLGGGIGSVKMLSGMLPDLRPGKGYPSGYSGRRRHPIMVDGEGEDGGAWMIWERKSKPSGSGTKTAGQLLGKKIKDGVWGETVLLTEGLIDYRPALPAKVRDGKMWVVGAKIPHHWNRPSQLVAIDVASAQPFEQEDWSDQFQPLSIQMETFEEREKMRYTTSTAEGKKLKLYWGDLHCHSGLTGDAEGEPDEILFYGRGRAGLDVMVMQDNDDVHGRILTEGEYYMGVAHSQWATEEGKFVALPGYEWTQRTSDKGVPRPDLSAFEQSVPGGYPNHRTVIYPQAGGPIVRYFEVEQDFGKMADAVHAAGGILNSQHPAFKISDHPAEANLEVTACWGIYIRSVPKRFHDELDKGIHRGFVGTSDSHRRNPGLCGGLTGIWAEELTSEAILEALKEHRCFATNGSRIVVDSRAQGRMSDSVAKAGSGGTVGLSVYLRGTKPLTRVTLIGDGGTVKVFKGDGSAKEMKLEHKVEGLKPGRHWFYWEIEQEGTSKQYSGNISTARGHWAWSSPHFVDVE